MLNRERLERLKAWLSAETIDDAEELFNETPTIIELIDFWLDADNAKRLKSDNDDVEHFLRYHFKLGH